MLRTPSVIKTEEKLLTLLLKTLLLILQFREEKCFICTERQRSRKQTQLPSPSEIRVSRRKQGKPSAPRLHGRMCYHPNSHSPRRVIVWRGLLFTFSIFSSFPSFFPDVLNQLFPSQLQTLEEEMLSGVFNYTQPIFNRLYQCHLKHWCFPGKV